MRSSPIVVATTAMATVTAAASLADLCTVANVQAALPANGTLNGIFLLPDTVTAAALYNVTAAAGIGAISSSSSPVTYCNVTVSYSRPGKNDVTLLYAFPDPATFLNRFYVAGGEGYTLSSSATGGLSYGAASGATSAGYDAFDQAYDAAVLYGNGSINWDATYMFGYEALGQMTLIGKPLTKAFYAMSDDTKLYTVSNLRTCCSLHVSFGQPHSGKAIANSKCCSITRDALTVDVRV
jgi:tannase